MTGSRRNRPGVRVCFVAPHAFPLLAKDNSILNVGGAELQQVVLARHLVKRGYSVSMICLDHGQTDQVEIDGITVFKSFAPGKGIPAIRFVWPRLWKMWNSLSAANADIYYQRAASVWTGIVALFCKRHKRRSIFAVAGDPMIRFRRDVWIYEYGVRNVDSIVVQNADQGCYFSQQFGRDSQLIPNCIAEEQVGGGTSSGYVLWVSTIRELKRPHLYLDLAQALPNARFVMVGGAGVGEERLFRDVKNRAAKLNNVRFFGFVPFREVGKHFDGAGIFVNTSTSEGFPNTFLQSWSRAIPTVSFIDSGARVNEMEVGCKVDTLPSMIEVVKQLLENDASRRRIGRECQEYALKNHSVDRVLDKYEGLFERLLNAG